MTVLRTIRTNKRFDDISFLMLTGEVEESRVAETIEAEVDAYIIKPFEIRTLEEKLVGILTKRRAPSALDIQVKLAERHREAGDHARPTTIWIKRPKSDREVRFFITSEGWYSKPRDAWPRLKNVFTWPNNWVLCTSGCTTSWPTFTRPADERPKSVPSFRSRQGQSQ